MILTGSNPGSGHSVVSTPAVSLVGSYELLVWLIRTAGPLERGLSADYASGDAVYCALARALSIGTAHGEGGSKTSARRQIRRGNR